MLYSSSDRKIKFFDGTTNRTTEVFVVQRIFVHGKHFLIKLDGVAIHTDRFCLPIFHASGKKGLNPPEVFPVYGSSQLNRKGFRKVPSFESRGLNIGKVVGQCFVTQMGSIKKFLGNKIIFLGIKIVEYNGHFRQNTARFMPKGTASAKTLPSLRKQKRFKALAFIGRKFFPSVSYFYCLEI